MKGERKRLIMERFKDEGIRREYKQRVIEAVNDE